jgi:hypothetical protein
VSDSGLGAFVAILPYPEYDDLATGCRAVISPDQSKILPSNQRSARQRPTNLKYFSGQEIAGQALRQPVHGQHQFAALFQDRFVAAKSRGWAMMRAQRRRSGRVSSVSPNARTRSRTRPATRAAAAPGRELAGFVWAIGRRVQPRAVKVEVVKTA